MERPKTQMSGWLNNVGLSLLLNNKDPKAALSVSELVTWVEAVLLDSLFDPQAGPGFHVRRWVWDNRTTPPPGASKLNTKATSPSVTSWSIVELFEDFKLFGFLLSFIIPVYRSHTINEGLNVCVGLVGDTKVYWTTSSKNNKWSNIWDRCNRKCLKEYPAHIELPSDDDDVKTCTCFAMSLVIAETSRLENRWWRN